MSVSDAKPEKYLSWKEVGQVEGEPTPRLFTPRSDPMKWEYPIDCQFATVEQAVEWLVELEVTKEEAKNYVLCEKTVVPLIIQPDLSGLADE